MLINSTIYIKQISFLLSKSECTSTLIEACFSRCSSICYFPPSKCTFAKVLHQENFANGSLCNVFFKYTHIKLGLYAKHVYRNTREIYSKTVCLQNYFYYTEINWNLSHKNVVLIKNVYKTCLDFENIFRIFK